MPQVGIIFIFLAIGMLVVVTIFVGKMLKQTFADALCNDKWVINMEISWRFVCFWLALGLDQGQQGQGQETLCED